MFVFATVNEDRFLFAHLTSVKAVVARGGSGMRWISSRVEGLVPWQRAVPQRKNPCGFFHVARYLIALLKGLRDFVELVQPPSKTM